jgi:hypothetical protein
VALVQVVAFNVIKSNVVIDSVSRLVSAVVACQVKWTPCLCCTLRVYYPIGNQIYNTTSLFLIPEADMVSAKLSLTV